MPEAYNPIIRTFCQVRSGLVDILGVDRRDVRPGTPLEVLIPVEGRGEVWKRLQRRGLRLPGLEPSLRHERRDALAVLMATVASVLYFRKWYAILLAFPAAMLVCRAGRHRAGHFPSYVRTVGELVIYATDFGGHEASGYRWTRNEIALKVRMTLAESTGSPLEEIQPETKLAELR